MRSERSASRLTQAAFRASTMAAKISGSAELHEKAAKAHARAAKAWEGANDSVAEEHRACVDLERRYARAIRAFQQ